MKSGESYSVNYSNIVFSCLTNDETMCFQRGNSHSLMCVYSGEVVISLDGKEILVVSAGEKVFVRRDHRITFLKRPANGQQYKSISMVFDRNFLRHYYRNLNSKFIPEKSIAFDTVATKLPESPNIESIFTSMLPFFESNERPIEEVMKLRLQEAILILLKLNDNFYATLFDFADPWKIDILDFLNQNYMYELSIEEIASFTGRSLATFKRDFRKISDLTPQKWITIKRLETALCKIEKENKKISEVYSDVGFKNRSHFATLFKKHYGYPPASIAK